MKIGIGLPNVVPGTPGRRLVEWAQRAEERGFSGLATIDRIAYPNHDSLASLAAAAGATSRIELMTNILLAPMYPAAVLAKVAATIDQVSDGRFTLGLAPGGRADDFSLVGRDMRHRGRDLDAALDLMELAWRGEPVPGSELPISPVPVHGRVPVLIGGGSEAALRRAATRGDGYTIGGAGAAQAGPAFAQFRAAWLAAGREGEPRVAALAYFSLGADAEEASRSYLRYYYGFLGEYTEYIVEGALRTPEAVKEAVAAFEDAGCTELYLDPTTSSLDQIDRLADVVL